MRAGLLCLLVACGGPQSPSEVDLPDGVRTWVNETTTAGGTLTVQVTAPEGVAVDVGAPVAEGLDLTAAGEARVETAGDHQVLTQTWAFSGHKGSFEIKGPTAIWDGTPHSATGLFVDVGVDAPREGELAEITTPTTVYVFPWALAGGALALLGLGLWTVAVRLRRPAPEPEETPVAPDVAALAAWDAARHDPTLDDNGRALAISRIFREYVEAVLSFPASAWTTSEIVAHVATLAHLPSDNPPRAKRLLRATDRVKFAEEGATTALFDQLDADLRLFVSDTRPATMPSSSDTGEPS